jgi:hypothetical protein
MRVRDWSPLGLVRNCWMDNLRPDGALRWKVETIGREGRRVVCGKSAPPRLYPPPVSVKDRWVGPLLVSLVTCSWTYVWLKRTASVVVLGEKLRRVPRTTQTVSEVESGAFFLGSSESVQLCWLSVTGRHVWGPPTGNVRVTYVDWHGKCTCCVDQVFPCMVYIDLNCHNSRIWVIACSWQSSRS